MGSIYSIYKFNTETKEIKNRIKEFSHPLVDCARTRVIVDLNPKQSSLEVQLFDYQGNYLLQDVSIGEGYSYPGLIMTLHPREKEIRIQNIYVKPEYYGRGLGTAFVKEMMVNAKREGYERIKVTADDKTNAVEYWRRVHEFNVVDRLLPLVLEKRI